MEIDTDVNPDALENHPVARALDREERALYVSLVWELADAAETISRLHGQSNEEPDFESAELADATNRLRDVITLSELLEDTAAGRREGVQPPADSDEGKPSEEER